MMQWTAKTTGANRPQVYEGNVLGFAVYVFQNAERVWMVTCNDTSLVGQRLNASEWQPALTEALGFVARAAEARSILFQELCNLARNEARESARYGDLLSAVPE